MQHNSHHPQHHEKLKREPGHLALALSATFHCLIGCGLGEILGMVLGTWWGMSNMNTMVLALSLGAVLGLLFGMWPLLRAGYNFKKAFRQTLVAEGLSIAVMETVEVLVQVYTPGVMDAHLTDGIFWIGMGLGLLAGFIAALPVNYWFVRKGIKHQH